MDDKTDIEVVRECLSIDSIGERAARFSEVVSAWMHGSSGTEPERWLNASKQITENDPNMAHRSQEMHERVLLIALSTSESELDDFGVYLERLRASDATLKHLSS